MKSVAARYGNFRDPLGLVWRMICRGDLAGHHALLQEAARRALAPCDRALAREERRLMASEPARELPLILIVGPPRSGSTMLAQVLASVLDVGFATNLESMFPRSPLTATRLLQRWQHSPSHELRSCYGVTSGWQGLNDAFFHWDRFLGDDRYAPRVPVDEGTALQMRRHFAHWTSIADKPILNKNNRNLACAATLARALPTALLLCTWRSPLAIAQSLLRARRWVQGSVERGWGLHARDASPAAGEFAAVDAVADQVEQLEGTRQRERAAVPASRWLDVSYEQFCANPRRLVERILLRVPGLTLRPDWQRALQTKLEPATRIHLSAAIVARLERRFAACAVPEPHAETSQQAVAMNI
jgi:hypothetical protein